MKREMESTTVRQGIRVTEQYMICPCEKCGGTGRIEAQYWDKARIANLSTMRWVAYPRPCTRCYATGEVAMLRPPLTAEELVQRAERIAHEEEHRLNWVIAVSLAIFTSGIGWLIYRAIFGGW